ncbi:fatty acyl-AMP ligase [Streptomyces sp. NPDC002896]|uniref:fatty acyl-AMP ligase n=1 Tax=Streptomyces sp. NPDC002896 TaxID=3154438 RepID=UPI0033239AAF
MTLGISQCNSVLSALRNLYETQPEKLLFTFVGDDGEDAETLRAGELAEAVDSVASSLRLWGLAPGDRAVLVYPPSLDFVKAFMGCLAAGVLPVPVYPPNPFRLKRDLVGFNAIVESSGARAALTNGLFDRSRRAGSVAGLLGRSEHSWPRIPWYRTDRRSGRRSGNGCDPGSWHEPADPGDTAFLQYTSGSTGVPKGVMVTHGNLVHEIAANVVDLRLDPDTRGVFWLPQYHDMGLINVILSTALGNSTTHIMSPLTFLQRPALWLDVMSRVGATITSAPNFAYELAVRKTTPEIRAGWDLSSLEMAITAAEPIRTRTIRAFLDAFAVSRIRPHVFYGAYGLAENTASVTNRGQGVLRLDKKALEDGQVVPVDDTSDALDLDGHIEYYGCGFSSKPGDRIRIVDPDTGVPCPPERVGEIWVRSSTTAAGYYGRPETTREVFHATVTGDDDPTEYLRTGDLGFLHEGQLFMTGRIKDLIIIRGRNVYPSDIEDSVRECHASIRPGGIVAFALGPDEKFPGDTVTGPDADDAGERLVVFAETGRKRVDADLAAEICAMVRKFVYADHQLSCHTVVLGRPGLVRKTTSGKVRRRVCKEALLSGEIDREATTLLVSVHGNEIPTRDELIEGRRP